MKMKFQNVSLSNSRFRWKFLFFKLNLFNLSSLLLFVKHKNATNAINATMKTFFNDVLFWIQYCFKSKSLVLWSFFFQMNWYEFDYFDISNCLFYFTLIDRVYLTTNQFAMYVQMKNLNQKQNSNEILNKINLLFFQYF